VCRVVLARDDAYAMATLPATTPIVRAS